MIEIKTDTTAEGNFDIDINLDGNLHDIVHEMSATIAALVKDIKASENFKTGVSEEKVLAVMFADAMIIIKEGRNRG